MKRSTTVLFLAALAGGLAPCASAGTKLVTSWQEPSVSRLAFKKVLVVVFAPHESQRRFGEAELVKLIKKTRAVAAYSVMTEDDVKDEAADAPHHGARGLRRSDHPALPRRRATR